MRYLRKIQGVTRLDRVLNEDIRRRLWVEAVLAVAGSGSGSGDHCLDWGAFSHRLFSQAPSKEKGEKKGNTVQNKTERRNDVKVKTCMEDLQCWVHSSSYKNIKMENRS